MPVRTSVHNESTSPVQSFQASSDGFPRRSNSVGGPSSTNNEAAHRRLKRNRHCSGASVGSSDGQPVCRKLRRNLSSAENSIHEAPEISDLISEGRSEKCFADSSESDSNSRIDAIKTVVNAVVDTDDVSGTQTPQSNDEEGNNSENDDEQVAKLPNEPGYESSPDSAHPVVENSNETISPTNQRSLNSIPSPSSVPRSISCDPSIPSTSKSCFISNNDPTMDAAFRQFSKNSLSSFSSVTSLVESVIEPLLLSTLSPFPKTDKEDISATTPNNSDESSGPIIGNGRMQRKRKRKSESISSTVKTPKRSLSSSKDEEGSVAVEEESVHVYPLRSRLRIEKQRKEWEDKLYQPRNLDTLPMELILRIVQYLSVQDLFALQGLNKNLQHACRYHLSSLKRINFSSGLPFAYLPEKLDDAALSHILRFTPEVTHILGFYPRKIYKANTVEVRNVKHALTYEGILSAFQTCTKLRSVELMDVGLMSLLVRQMPNVKFHGMFRNRPDSWDEEYAVPLPPEGSPNAPVIPSPASVPPTSSNTAQSVVRFVNQQAARNARLARRFEIITEAPIGQGSPITPIYPFVFQRPLSQTLQQETGHVTSLDVNSLHNSMLTFAVAAAMNHQDGQQIRSESTLQTRRARSSTTTSSSTSRRQSMADFIPGVTAAASAGIITAYTEGRPSSFSLVSPLHLTRTVPISLPEAIVNLTKLDLVAVPVTILPRLDNVKYLHLKWVHFSDQDPFLNFQASKLQSFVMNNCVGPRRFVRFIRLFAFLTRAAQIMRLELVGTRLVEGLFEQLIDRQIVPSAPCFRNLQRLVLAGGRDITISDAGLILFCAQQSLTHLALQTFHSDNSLFEALNFARVRLSRLESLILGYQDPYLSRLVPADLHDLDLCDSPDSTNPCCTLTNRGLTLALSVCPRIGSLTLRQAPYITRFPRSDEILATYPSPSSPTSNPENSNLPPSNPLVPPSAASAAAASTAPISRRPPSLYAHAINTITNLGLQPTSSSLDSQAESAHQQEPQSNPNQQPRGPSPLGSQLILRLATMRPGVPVKSLTLENCPGLTSIEVENVLARGDPFGVLESLVLRDMFPLSRATCSQVAPYNWISRWTSDPLSSIQRDSSLTEQQINYHKLGLLLVLSDLLASRIVTQAPLGHFGIAMGTSVREVNHATALQTVRITDLPVQPYDVFFTLRTHTYLSTLLQMDGSVGSVQRIPRLIFEDPSAPSLLEVKEEEESQTSFASRATQTCVCGLLELDFCHRLCLEGGSSSESNSLSTTETSGQESSGGAPPYLPPQLMSVNHNSLFQRILSGQWAEKICKTRAFVDLKNAKSIVKPLCGSAECQGCCSGLLDAPSRTQAEDSLSARPRTWIARDACVDTSDLRCYTGPKPCVFTLRQPFNYPFSCLTTLHLEKVGISHLVLSGVPRLKNITLENCPILAGILLAPTASHQNSPKMLEAAPALKRIRIIRCPKFAIWHWLATVASLYPQHDENLFITYRPFGEYNEQVEQALWRKIQGAHVTVSHDYSIDRSERAMEETNSAFEQRFRELMQLTDLVHNGMSSGIMEEQIDVDSSSITRLYHTDRGENWNLMTDASWMPRGALNPTIEVTLNKPIPPTKIVPGNFDEAVTTPTGDHPQSNEEIRESEARKRRLFGQFLSEYRKIYHFHRRGVHLHVQHRDIHAGIVDGDRDGQYLTWPYTESYLKSMTPEDDLNVWGDGHDSVLREQLPPRFLSVTPFPSLSLSHHLKREHSQVMEEENEGIPVERKHPRMDVSLDCDNRPKEEDQTESSNEAPS